MSPVGINGVDKQGVGINGVQVKQALDAANETVNEGVYDPTTLSTVDVDLAAGNIALGSTIFGFVGTVVPGPGSVDQDVDGADYDVPDQEPSKLADAERWVALAVGEHDLLSTTITPTQATPVHGTSVMVMHLSDADADSYLHFYIDGVLQETSANFGGASANHWRRITFQHSKDCAAGARIVKVTLENDGAASKTYFGLGAVYANADKAV